MLKISCCFPQP